MTYSIEMSQLFADQFRILPQDQVPLVQSKISLLLDDPRPFGKNKTRLVGANVPPRFRIRAGNYRVIYSYTSDTIWLWNVDKRSDVYVRHIASRYLPVAESTIDNDQIVELQDETPDAIAAWAHYRDGLREWLTSEHPRRRNHRSAFHNRQPHARNQATPLPSQITVEMLDRIAIPDRYHRALITCETDDDLVRAVTEHGIPAEAVDRVFSLVVDPDFEYIRNQPRKQLKHVEDLTRFHTGDLLDFMVALDTEQRQVAKSVAENGGPALISGSAGTGKSAVLLETAIALASKNPGRRILFTTFTTGLLNNTEELLRRVAPHLLPQFAFRTTASVAGSLLRRGSEPVDHEVLEVDSQQRILREIVRDLVLNWIPARQLANFTPRRVSLSGSQIEAGPLGGMSWDYLLQEIDHVIIGRGIDQELDYLTEPRDGRRVRLSDGQRAIVWEIGRRFVDKIREDQQTTYPLLMMDASRKVVRSRANLHYDAVFVDEAQDLSPTAIRMLVELARGDDGHVRHLYLSADGDQTIYGNSYSWISIHPDLRLQGRSRRLRTNYRSTGEIVEAARSYLSSAGLEADRVAPAYLHSGPIPIALRIGTETREIEEITSFFRQSCAEIGRDFADCALLVGTRKDGQRFTTALRRAGIESNFMSRSEVNLSGSGVKVMTRHTAKGLEFPIVAVSLRLDRSQSSADGEERQESNQLNRRINHMAMTRAMRSLLVTLPLSDNEHTSGITPPLWDVRDTRRPTDAE